MKYTDKLGLPIWNKPETDAFDIEQFNEGMQAIDDIVIHILKQINDLAIGDTKVDLNEYVKKEVLKEYDKRIANKADKEEVETINSHLDNIKNLEINPKQFGAKGDGINNDTKAFQDAIDYLESNAIGSNVPGGKIMLEPGEYLIDNLSIYGAIEFVGSNSGAVTLTYCGDGTTNMINVPYAIGSLYYLTFINLKFNGKSKEGIYCENILYIDKHVDNLFKVEHCILGSAKGNLIRVTRGYVQLYFNDVDLQLCGINKATNGDGSGIFINQSAKGGSTPITMIDIHSQGCLGGSLWFKNTSTTSTGAINIIGSRFEIEGVLDYGLNVNNGVTVECNNSISNGQFQLNCIGVQSNSSSKGSLINVLNKEIDYNLIGCLAQNQTLYTSPTVTLSKTGIAIGSYGTNRENNINGITNFSDNVTFKNGATINNDKKLIFNSADDTNNFSLYPVSYGLTQRVGNTNLVTYTNSGNIGFYKHNPTEKIEFGETVKFNKDCIFNNKWNGDGLLRLGNYRIWVDNLGNLRIKNGVPQSETDGTIVGTQS